MKSGTFKEIGTLVPQTMEYRAGYSAMHTSPRREAPNVGVNRFKRKRGNSMYQPSARQKQIRIIPPQ